MQFSTGPEDPAPKNKASGAPARRLRAGRAARARRHAAAGGGGGPRDLTVTDADVRHASRARRRAAGQRAASTFEFDGQWQAAYRDILLKKGERITDVSVSEGGRRFRSGGCTIVGCIGRRGHASAPPRSPGGDGVRIVWHHQASDETRTFTVCYRVEDAVVAYDDVLDVDWQVWGDQWDFDLAHLGRNCPRPGPAPAPRRGSDSRESIGGLGQATRRRGPRLPRARAWRDSRPTDVRDGHFVDDAGADPADAGPEVSGRGPPGDGDGLRADPGGGAGATTTTTTRSSTGPSAGSPTTRCCWR